MGWSFPIGAVKGTVIRVHITFLVFLVWIGVSSFVQGGRDAAIQGVVFIVLLFLCVLLHEFGHVVAARRYGVQTPDITLLPIGGVARLERIPEEPGQELVVALAGPAVNLFLVVFNLIPAFPMDGGRVLRAVLAHRLGYARGTQIAAGVGQAFAFGLGLLGLFGNPLLIFIALFVYLGAASEAHAVQMRQVTRSMLASDAMISRFESLTPGSRVEDAVRCLIETTQHEFPVVDGAGGLRGVLTRDDMIRALRERGPDTPVPEVMRADIPVVRDRQCLADALRLMQERRVPAVGVVDSRARLIGLITPENVGEMMMVLAARPDERTPARA